MKFLYLVHFNAPMGGLHENVYASALYMKKKGHKVSVVLKDGPLRERLKEHNIHTISTDYTNIEQTLKKIEAENIGFDLIHTHPGLSRKTAQFVAKKYDVPLVITFHGMWIDSLNQYIDKTSAVIAVSEGIKTYLQNEIKNSYEKFFVISNGYDNLLLNEAKFYDKKNDALKVGLVTRLDEDKQFIMDIFMVALKHLKSRKDYTITFNIIGDGKLKEKFMLSCEETLKDTKHEIEFSGWLTDGSLKEAYLENDIVMAPGRSVIESMASGKPTISVGSKKYIGLIKDDNWKQGVFNNFGGYGAKFDDYIPGSVEKDFDVLLNDRDNINLIGRFSHEIATEYYNGEEINEKLLRLYRSIILEDQIKKSLSNI